MLTKALQRGFARATKHAKGSFGRESSLAANSGFPKHKELFADHYYDKTLQDGYDYEAEMRKSPVQKKLEEQDKRYSDDQYIGDTEKLNIEGGILKKYGRLRNKLPEEVMAEEYFEKNMRLGKEAMEMFNMNTLTEKELMNATKNITNRLRLNRDLELNRKFSDQHLIKSQYGDYEKYDSAKISIEVNEND